MLATQCFPNALLPTNKMVDFTQTKETVKVFNTLYGLQGLAIQALKHLQIGNLDEFDALATDCSCHLRALRVATIMQELLQPASALTAQLDLTLKDLEAKQAILLVTGSDLMTYAHKLKNKEDLDKIGNKTGVIPPIISALKALKSVNNTDSNSFPVQDALQQLKVISVIPNELAYVIYAHILKVVKDFILVTEMDNVTCADPYCEKTITSDALVKKETTNLKLLSGSIRQLSQGDINSKLIEKECYALAKKHLTDFSVDYLLRETFKLKSPHIHTFLSFSKKEVNGKVELPDFYSLTGTFQVCLEKQIPVFLKIKKCQHAHRYQEPTNPFDVYVYLTPNNTGTGFELGSILDLEENNSIVVVEGKRSGKVVAEESVSNYVKRLMKDFDFMKICEMDGAQHKQYTSDDNSLQEKPAEVIPFLKEGKFLDEATRLNGFKDLAEKTGCAFFNQNLLILSHIFADTVVNQQNELLQQLKAQPIQYDPIKLNTP